MPLQANNVLVVDDDESIREFLKLALELEGYEVKTASNGMEGLDVLRSISPPFLIILDLMMPVMDGWEFVAALNRDSRLAKPPIVVVTAFVEKAKVFQGAAIVLTKPIDLDHLLDIARKYFSESVLRAA